MLLLLGAAGLSGAPAEPALDERLREPFRDLLREARSERSRMEAAGFVVRLPCGRYVIVRWPEAELPDEARWEGPWPPGTVAIVHTHPNWMPQPSRIDRATAAKCHVDVYVVTSSGVARTAGAEAEVVSW